MRREAVDHVILDWNGTVVDDVGLAVQAVNSLRAASRLPALSLEEYRHHFGFPIEGFYRRIGFDLNATSFSDLAARYLAIFNAGVLACRTHDGVDLTLRAAKQANAGTWVLSASHQDILVDDARQRGLYGYFDHIAGLSDRNAAGKQQIAMRLDQRMKSPGRRALLIGDTLHDVEIASSLGWSCIVVPHGHQSHAHLQQTSATMFANLRDVAAHIEAVTCA